MTETGGGSIQSVLNALRILEAIGINQPLGVSQLSRNVELPKSSVQRAVRTLHHAGWIRPVGGEQTRWELTSHLLGVSLRAFGEYSLRELAEPTMNRLRDATGETVHLIVLDPDRDEGIVLHRVDSSQAVRAFVEIGSRSPLHATASGLAMMSQMNEDEVTRILDRPLTTFTGNTVTDPESLREKLAEFRSQGYAVNVGEWRPEVASVSSPILRADGTPSGALTISIPYSRFSQDLAVEYGALVNKATVGLDGALAPAPSVRRGHA